MKAKLLALVSLSILLLASGSSLLAGQIPPEPIVSTGPLFVAERGPHHKTWSRVTQFADAAGRVHTRTNVAYTELATGMHYLDPEDGQWKESSAEIVPVPMGAAATRGQHKVVFASDIATPGAIDMTMSDGRHLTSHVLGLAYLDTASGKRVVIGEVKSSVGQISGNQVIYGDAMSGVKADIIYTYSRAGLEQDCHLNEAPAEPEIFGLDGKTTRLQVLTEFLSAPEPGKTARLVGPDLIDERLDFGALLMVQGKAFSVGAEENAKIAVGKQWIKWHERNILVEEVPFTTVAEELRKLHAREGAGVDSGSKRFFTDVKELIPELKPSRAKTQPMLMASTRQERQGFVLDYITLNGAYTNLTLWANSTYKIGTGGVTCAGTLVLEGGAVVKVTSSTNYYVGITAENVVCRTGAHLPATITVDTDDSIGEDVTVGDQTPELTSVGGLACTNGLSGIRFRYLQNGAIITAPSPSITNCQFVQCYTGVKVDVPYSLTFTAQNLLFDHGYEGMNLRCTGTLNISAEHLTADGCYTVVRNDAPSTLATIKNSIFLEVSLPFYSTYTYVGSEAWSWVNLPYQTSAFASAGAGHYYLPANSPYINAGTTNIGADIRGLTTQAPTILSNVTVTTALTFSPQATRDCDIPDLGYHYAPIDYITASVVITNAPLTIAPGTIIAHFNQYGIWLQEGAEFTCTGSATAHNKFLSYRLVQEQALKIGGIDLSAGYPVASYRTTAASAAVSFTDFLCLAGDLSAFLVDDSWQMSPADVHDCQFIGGTVNVLPYNFLTVSMNNNVFDQVNFTAMLQPDLSVCNNLFRLSTVYIEQWGNNPWRIKDNLFDGCGVDYDPAEMMAADYSHNAYFLTTPPVPLTTNDVALTSLNYVAGPLGNYYYTTTNLVNAGSRTAAAAGLYHHTTSYLQAAEANSQVDIGFHYVALNAQGKPLDSDSDGIPNIDEDSNGNSAVDSGETHWQVAADPGLRVRITRPSPSQTIP